MGNFLSRCGCGLKLDHPDLAAESIQEPTAESVQELAAKSVQEPTAESVQEPVAGSSVQEPAAESNQEPDQINTPKIPKFGQWEDEAVDGNFTTWFTVIFTQVFGKRKKDSTTFLEEEEIYIKSKLLELNNQKHSSLIVFSLSELILATNYFSRRKLGVGGFGNVYKGYLEDEMAQTISKMADHQNEERLAIAVKKLETSSKQGFQQWLTEIVTLGGVSHPNIVKLFGYCSQNLNFLIVYELMIKGSLDYHLFRNDSKHVLTWETRLKIMVGMARGLAYLHTMDDPTIHRDIKSSNILLDENYNAKISDFGLAHRKSMPLTEEEGAFMGTKGYAAPEYLESGKLDIKSDVYGFGVVLIEMLTGLRAIDKKRPDEQLYLLDWIRPKLSKKTELKNIMDSRLEGKYAFKEARQIAELAIRCANPLYKRRPSMMEVVDTLQRIGASYKIT